jgi:hypothetical protein
MPVTAASSMGAHLVCVGQLHNNFSDRFPQVVVGDEVDEEIQRLGAQRVAAEQRVRIRRRVNLVRRQRLEKLHPVTLYSFGLTSADPKFLVMILRTQINGSWTNVCMSVRLCKKRSPALLRQTPHLPGGATYANVLENGHVVAGEGHRNGCLGLHLHRTLPGFMTVE